MRTALLWLPGGENDLSYVAPASDNFFMVANVASALFLSPVAR